MNTDLALFCPVCKTNILVFNISDITNEVISIECRAPGTGNLSRHTFPLGSKAFNAMAEIYNAWQLQIIASEEQAEIQKMSLTEFMRKQTDATAKLLRQQRDQFQLALAGLYRIVAEDEAELLARAQRKMDKTNKANNELSGMLKDDDQKTDPSK